MTLTLTTDRDTARAFANALAAELGATAVLTAPTPDDTRADPVAVAALVLSLPSALLAAYDLADRVKLLPHLRRALAALPPGARLLVATDRGTATLTGPDDAARLLDLATEASPQPHDAVVCAAGPDTAAAVRLAAALRATGRRVHLAPADATDVAAWNNQRAARASVVLVGPTWHESAALREQLARAVALAPRGHTLVVVQMPGVDAADLPPGALSGHRVRYDDDATALAATITRLLAR